MLIDEPRFRGFIRFMDNAIMVRTLSSPGWLVPVNNCIFYDNLYSLIILTYDLRKRNIDVKFLTNTLKYNVKGVDDGGVNTITIIIS